MTYFELTYTMSLSLNPNLRFYCMLLVLVSICLNKIVRVPLIDSLSLLVHSFFHEYVLYMGLDWIAPDWLGWDGNG